MTGVWTLQHIMEGGGGYILPQYVKQLGIPRNLKATLETNYFSSHILKRAKQAAKSLIHKII